MTEGKCISALLILSTLVCNVAALHPVAQTLSPARSQTDDTLDKSTDSSEEGHNRIRYYVSEGGPDEEGERAKKGYDRNYLRFGRHDSDEKRGLDRNFLRFGRNEIPLLYNVYEPTDLSEEEKRAARNFLRFGRGSDRNFLRFGKREEPLEIALGLPIESSEDIVKRGEDRNFLRFGKAADRNFLRFGRSFGSKLNEGGCSNCDQETEPPTPASLLSSKSIPETFAKRSRAKRSLSFYDDVMLIDPITPMSWGKDFAEFVPGDSSVAPSKEFVAKGQKRAHSRNFLRYGRDPLDLHFLRFGKRGSNEKTSSAEGEEDQMARYVRARTNKNFIRFG